MNRTAPRGRGPCLVLATAFAAALVGACDTAPDVLEGTDLDMSVSVQDRTRTFRVHVTREAKDGTPVRVIMAFHGSHDTGLRMQLGAGLDGPGAGEPTLLVYPDAAVADWAEGCDCSQADQLGIDDIGFVEAMLDTLGTRWLLDPGRTFAVGYSAGGMFVHRLGCDLSDRIGAVASVAASMSTGIAFRCDPPRPPSALLIHGAEDAVVPWSGGGRLLSLPAAAAFWARKNDCGDDPEVAVRGLGDDRVVTTREYADCYGQRRVVLHELEGYGHTWPRAAFAAGDAVVEFFDTEVP